MRRLLELVRRLRCPRHAWQTVEIIPAVVEVPDGGGMRAILRQRCGLCLKWRLRFDDGTEPSRRFLRTLDVCQRLAGKSWWLPYDAGRGFADPDAEPTLVLDPVESRHVQAEWLER